MATPNYDIGSVLSLKRNGGLERKKRRRQGGRMEEGVVRVESRQKRGREEVEVCCWLADEFSAALESSQQCMI